MSSSEMPYFCPRCGDRCRFPSVPELRAHLVSRHTYETLLLLSQARVRSSRPAGLLPLPGPAVTQSSGSAPASESSGLPPPLSCLDIASSSASLQLLRQMFSPSDPVLLPSGGSEEPSSALVPSGSVDQFPAQKLRQVEVCLGLDLLPSVRIGLEERLGLGLDHKIARTFAEVEERVNQRVGRLKAELNKREAELEWERRDRERLKSEKKEVEERAAFLSRQISAAVEMMERLKKDLMRKDKELRERQQEVENIEDFLRVMAEKEADAKSRLQVVFIEMLLERADRAERHLLLLASNHAHYALPKAYSPEAGRGGCSLDGSKDGVVSGRLQDAIGNRRSYSVSGSCRLEEQRYHSSLTRQMRTLSLGSGGWDCEGLSNLLHTGHCGPAWTQRDRDGRRDRFWVEEEGWGRTWSRRNRRHHSTEEEEEEEEEEELWSSTEMRRLACRRTYTPGSDSPSSLLSTPSRHYGDRQLGVGSLRMRAGLFCIFPYLDVRSLLRAAEVCSDWRFVARHPAVWTRVRLEDGRVSADFLNTLSQWCSQTQSLVLKNLKPRNRRADETREDHHKHTRGSLEPGLEALLRSAGGSLLQLSIVQCPHVLTDRTLWITSCYSRNLQVLVYRSSSDPPGPEVLWALGAGCRNISSLQVAPVHPCQQPTRFGNRCLQTIGRCWPHLHILSVGGASCSTQGLAAVAQSCSQLQVLELERITDLSLQAATELCKAGLRGLQMLVLTHTPVSGQAILHFHTPCVTVFDTPALKPGMLRSSSGHDQSSALYLCRCVQEHPVHRRGGLSCRLLRGAGLSGSSTPVWRNSQHTEGSPDASRSQRHPAGQSSGILLTSFFFCSSKSGPSETFLILTSEGRFSEGQQIKLSIILFYCKKKFESLILKVFCTFLFTFIEKKSSKSGERMFLGRICRNCLTFITNIVTASVENQMKPCSGSEPT
ncbi:F-box only protein 41 isoform X3 [Oryzias melastigma]|uniref:F-box only protein 41 isoform X3 n=1 Tax=Oryzias melastigma TaxID=30732 RepID=UPI00168CFD53|nr:F-box only protein 41 isoform X3 [Oryzias melastigma]